MIMMLLAAAIALADRGDAQVAAPPPSVDAPARRVVRRPAGRRGAARRLPADASTRIAAANYAATIEPRSDGFVNGTQVFPFAEGAIYHAYVAPGAITDIALEPGEQLVAVAAGDTARWVIGDTTSGSGTGKRGHVLVKPFSAGLATSLVITTDRRAYHVRLTATPRTALAAVSWSYPADQLIALRGTAEQTAAPAPSGPKIEDLRFDYAISGASPRWRPLRAFDDGRKVYVEFPRDLATAAAPPLFVVDPTGGAELVNYRVRGHFYEVDRLFDVAELRLGSKKPQVVRIERRASTNASKPVVQP